MGRKMRYSLWVLNYFVVFVLIAGPNLYAQPVSDLATDKEVIFLLVDKTKLVAKLKTWPSDPSDAEQLMSLRIAIGKAHGDKQVEGDNKTPEGIYFTQQLIDGKTLPAKYGPFAIPINFPNEFDRKQKKTGYGIWLHGVEKDARIEEANVTEGCVAFYNADIISLANWLRPKQTLVMITDDSSQVNVPEDLEAIRTATKQWYQAWQSREIGEYIDKYQRDFKYRGKDIDAYKAYKDRVFNSYENMTIQFSNLRVFSHAKYAVAIMNQNFQGDDRYSSQGRKILYWTKSDDGWKIAHEVFEELRFEPQPYSRELFAKLSKDSPSAKHTSSKKSNL